MPHRLDARRDDFEARFAAFLARKREAEADVDDVVAGILAAVRARGDAALGEFTLRFDHVDLREAGIRFSEGEIAAAAGRCEAATIAALRSRIDGGDRVLVIFEPRSYTSRTKVFEKDFALAFATADEVVICAAHLPLKVPEVQRISEQTLVASINREGGKARFIPAVDEIVADLAERLRPGDHALVLSNGGFGGIHEKLLAALGR